MSQEWWERATAARHARLATVTPAGQPHLVPIVYALSDRTLVTAVDHKPKRHTRLRRLDNIASNPAVSVLVDHYDDNWSGLWWVRLDGIARIIGADDAAHGDAVAPLVSKYPQYGGVRLGDAISIEVTSIAGWSAS